MLVDWPLINGLSTVEAVGPWIEQCCRAVIH